MIAAVTSHPPSPEEEEKGGRSQIPTRLPPTSEGGSQGLWKGAWEVVLARLSAVLAELHLSALQPLIQQNQGCKLLRST